MAVEKIDKIKKLFKKLIDEVGGYEMVIQSTGADDMFDSHDEEMPRGMRMDFARKMMADMGKMPEAVFREVYGKYLGHPGEDEVDNFYLRLVVRIELKLVNGDEIEWEYCGSHEAGDVTISSVSGLTNKTGAATTAIDKMTHLLSGEDGITLTEWILWEYDVYFY